MVVRRSRRHMVEFFFVAVAAVITASGVGACEREEAAPVEETPGAGTPKNPQLENKTLDIETCRLHILHVNAHAHGFYDPSSLDRYHRCLWLLRHERKPSRQVFIGGQHYPTIVVANHLEPEMRLPTEKRLPRPRRRHMDIPLQPFEDTQSELERFERRVPHHFVVPGFDVNIGNVIKNQGSMNHLQSYHMQMMLRTGDTVLDVGANLGCYTVAMAEAVGPSGRVFAFEPFRWLHQLLTANVALNGLQNVWPVRAALGSARKVLHLVPPQLRFFSSPGGVRVANQTGQIVGRPHHEAFQLYDLLARGEEPVRVVRLDELFLGGDEAALWWGLPVPIADMRLMKIDVEGMEAAVAAGAAATIRLFKPIIWSENNGYFESDGRDKEFLQVMANLGYGCSRAPSAPTDLICMDESGSGHRI